MPSFPRITWNRRNALIAAGVVVGLLAVVGVTLAVTGGDGATTTTAPTTSTSSTSTTLPGTPAPLTGIRIDDEIAQRPALVLKIDNHNANARPQAGITEADVIYEEQVEGGVTRLAAVFQSRDADPVGPIRSGRTTDIQIVTPLNRPLFGFSGANAATLAEILASPIIDVRWDARPTSYRRVPDRSAPHNLFTTTAELYDSVDDDDIAGPPPTLFSFRPTGRVLQRADARGARQLHIGFPAGYTADWRWNAAEKAFLRTQNGTPHVDADGTRVAVQNVIVQFVAYGVRFGNPEAQLIGSGDAWVFTDGKVVKARWSRPSINSITTYAGLDGKVVALTPGQTWIELPQVGQSLTINDAPAS